MTQLVRALVVIVAGALLGCDRPKVPQRVQAVAALSTVQWRLEWDTDRLQRDGAAWRLHTDRGYDLTLDQGTLVTWRLGLEPCPPQRATGWHWPSIVAEAWAHHVEPPDPTSVMPHLREDVLAATPTDLPVRAVPPDAYCRGLWLVSAPPPAQAGDQPRVSIALHGQWRRDGQAGELNLATWVPDARLDGIAGLRDVHGAAQVTITRHLADAFDGVDLADAPTEALAWHVLHRLTSRATVQVQPQ